MKKSIAMLLPLGLLAACGQGADTATQESTAPTADAAADPANVMPPEPLAAGITVSDAWARETTADAKAGGAFMTIANGGPGADRLVSASSDASAVTQIHATEMVDGVMQMREQADGIALDEKELVTLKPGGLHIMFMDLKAPLKAGSNVKVTLTFEKGGAKTVDVPVLSMADVEARGGAKGGDAAHSGDMHK